jgi:L-cystine uptake protein TcyP (sodium:dicarboxylate symporter family)
MVPRIERGISTFEATSLLGKQLSKNLLLSLIVVLVLWAVAATIGHFIPEKDVLVAFEVRQTKDGPDISRRVQKIVGYVPERVITTSPALGRILALKPENGTEIAYKIEAHRTVHVYIIGQSPAPLLFTFIPGRLGHRSSYQIILQNAEE